MILALETSTSVCSVALCRDGKVIGQTTIYEKNSHAEIIIDLVKQLLIYTRHTIKDLSLIAISAGPGSYTGLRIGSSIAKGLSFSLGIPLIGINTLESMAFGIQQYNFQNCLLCPMIDARRQEVYTLIIDSKSNTILPTCSLILKHDTFADLLQKNQIIFFGDGANKVSSCLAQNKNIIVLHHIYPQAVTIAQIGYLNSQQKKFNDVASFAPFYLKEFGQK